MPHLIFWILPLQEGTRRRAYQYPSPRCAQGSLSLLLLSLMGVFLFSWTDLGELWRTRILLLAAVYSPDLALALKHKLPAETSIFSAEAWAIYQALILLESISHTAAAVFSDSRSVLDALSSFSFKPCANYLIPLIRYKYHALIDRGISINFAWVPSHRDVLGNERVDSFAKQAALNGRKPKFRIPHTDLYSSCIRSMKTKNHAYLTSAFLTKGIFYYSNYFRTSPPLKPWFSRFPLSRDRVVAAGRIRSNHYNLNYTWTERILWPPPPVIAGIPDRT